MRHCCPLARTLVHRRGAVTFVASGLLTAALAVVYTADPKFFSDDPLSRDPETQDASGAQPWDIDLFYDLSYNLFVTPGRIPAGIRARNVNTIDEVPDSSWFTNRMGTRALTVDEVVRGPVAGPAPATAKWIITREKSAGAAPGFTAEDANGQTWFVSFDSTANPEGATGAVVVATKIFWALGYNQVEYFLTTMSPGTMEISPKATTRRPSGDRTPLKQDDVRAILERADRRPDGSYRTAAGRLLPGKVLGGFKYEGTRPDDPNDVVPHEHRRELRALRVFGAWTNLTDMKQATPSTRSSTRVDAVWSATTSRTSAPRSAWAPTARTTGTKDGTSCTTDRPRDAGCSPSGSPSVPGKRPTTRSTRPSVASKATPSIPRPGSHVRRRRPTSRCATTTPSGRRSGSWRSPMT